MSAYRLSFTAEGKSLIAYTQKHKHINAIRAIENYKYTKTINMNLTVYLELNS